MAEIIRMPKLSDTMTEGVVAEWIKNVGDEVFEGELLAEIETDKATMEFESYYDGILLHIGVEKGATAPINSILAIIGNKGEDVAKILAEAEKNTPSDKTEEVVLVPKIDVPKPSTANTAVVKPAPVVSVSDSNGRVLASPLAKSMANEKGIDLTNVIGTGDAGRIIKRDIDHYTPYVGGGVAKSGFIGVESFQDEPISQMRKTIAKRLSESKFTAPHFYLTLDIDMDNAIGIREQINILETGKVSFNDMVIKACGLALREHPTVNSAWLGDVIRRNEHVHIGVAVAVDEGLLVPVVRFADGKELTEIGGEVRSYAKKAKDKKLQTSDWEGNTFTISNLGMFGIESFTAIVNPPDSCIMAVGGIKQVPVVKNGEIVPGNIMKVTLACDHRVVDGVSGSQFLNTFKKYMENPVSLLVK
ncbi:MAG: pyruvate dehydrogenase complex dihydrolipoamide acetyltransferase [Crocinitomicaceae bacterium]